MLTCGVLERVSEMTELSKYYSFNKRVGMPDQLQALKVQHLMEYVRRNPGISRSKLLRVSNVHPLFLDVLWKHYGAIRIDGEDNIFLWRYHWPEVQRELREDGEELN